jgi:hypothetical protein
MGIMRPSDEDTPDRGDGDSLADGVGEVSSSADPFGDELSDDTYGDDPDGDDGTDIGDTYGGDTYGGGDDDTFGDGSGEPDESVDVGGDTGSDDGTVLEGDDEVPQLEMVGHENSPFESVGHLLEEIGDALFGDEGDGDDEALVAAAAPPFDADPADIASDEDLDLTGDGVVDRADLHEATSVFDFGVAGGHHHHDVADG